MKKVLIVDDTKNIRLLLTKCLEHEGYQVETAGDGPQALEAFKRSAFDLVFLDIKMPGLSGTEVLKQIREMGISTPVIIITAYASVKNAVECTKLGAVSYLQKPFTADRIKVILNECFTIKTAADKKEQMESRLESRLKKIKELIDLNSFDEALSLLRESISVEMDNPEVYSLLSRLYQRMGNEKRSEQFMRVYEIFK